MHEQDADFVREPGERLVNGTAAPGVVVCHHVFGSGIYLEDRAEYAHERMVELQPAPRRKAGRTTLSTA